MADAQRKMTIALTPGSIGVKADQRRSIELAHYFGFESVQPFPKELAALTTNEKDDLRGELRAKGLVWAASGLPIDFRKDQAKFAEDLKNWPRLAQALRQAGVTRVGTWLMPTHDSLTYLENFKQTAHRLRQAATIAGDNGLRLGFEYVGTKTLWSLKKYAFVHTMAETKELLAEIDEPNAGLVLDTWHWWTSDESKQDILTLDNKDVVSCDLNDAPKGIPKEQQQDSKRALPVSTGVINMKSFLEGLIEIGYDGPVRAEPFSAELNAMDDEQACSKTIEAMRQAMALLG